MDNSTSLQEDHKGRKDNYFIWLFKQLHDWPAQNYMPWFFTFRFQLAILIQNKITALTLITFIDTLLGTLCVLAISTTKATDGWLDLISATCLIYAGLAVKNYLSIFERITYILASDLPVIILVRSWSDDTKNHLRKFGAREWIIAIVDTLIMYAVSGYLIDRLTNDSHPWIDTVSFAISLTAGIMCFLRYNNQYSWWTASGIFRLILWGVTYAQGDATLAMAVNSLIYVINDVLAFTVSPWFSMGRKREGLKTIKD